MFQTTITRNKYKKNKDLFEFFLVSMWIRVNKLFQFEKVRFFEATRESAQNIEIVFGNFRSQYSEYSKSTVAHQCHVTIAKHPKIHDDLVESCAILAEIRLSINMSRHTFYYHHLFATKLFHRFFLDRFGIGRDKHTKIVHSLGQIISNEIPIVNRKIPWCYVSIVGYIWSCTTNSHLNTYKRR